MLDKVDPDAGADLRRVDEALASHAEFCQLSSDPGAGLGRESTFRRMKEHLRHSGPNPLGPVDPKAYHWFTGSGMAHGLRLRGGRAEWYRNRAVASDSIAPLLGRPGLPGPRNGFGDNTANTNIIDMGGRTYAIVEAGGLPVELTYTLESVGRADLSGTLKHGFTAHPKIDPVTGELHAVTYQPGLEAISYLWWTRPAARAPSPTSLRRTVR